MQSEIFPILHSHYPKVIKRALGTFCVHSLFVKFSMTTQEYRYIYTHTEIHMPNIHMNIYRIYICLMYLYIYIK